MASNRFQISTWRFHDMKKLNPTRQQDSEMHTHSVTMRDSNIEILHINFCIWYVLDFARVPTTCFESSVKYECDIHKVTQVFMIFKDGLNNRMCENDSVSPPLVYVSVEWYETDPYITRQHSTQSVRNMPPPSPRHLLPHVLQIMPRNPKYDKFQPKGHHSEEKSISLSQNSIKIRKIYKL